MSSARLHPGVETGPSSAHHPPRDESLRWTASCVFSVLRAQGDQTNKVVYGAMEHGQALRPNEELSGLLRQVGQRLMIAEREVEAVPIKASPAPLPPSASGGTPAGAETPVGAAGNPGEEAKEGGEEGGVIVEVSTKGGSGSGSVESEGTGTVMVTGAVEMKGIVGSDNRSYLLDVARLTPRDANWVRGEKGTGVYDEWMKVSPGCRDG